MANSYHQTLDRAYILLRLTRLKHRMTKVEQLALEQEIAGIFCELDPDATFDDDAALAEFKEQNK